MKEKDLSSEKNQENAQEAQRYEASKSKDLKEDQDLFSHQIGSSEIATELEKTKADLVASNDQYLRLYAEFENFRRRAAKEKLVIIETANENILKQILEIVDDFERAMVVMQQSKQNQSAEPIQQGVQLIYDKIMHLLEQSGVKIMEVNQGNKFDTALHEAVTQTAVVESMRGTVVEVLEKGYYLKDKILRFAKVVIGA